MINLKSASARRRADFESESSHATKDNPYQPPWIRFVREAINLIIGLMFLIGAYYVVDSLGEKIPGAVHRAAQGLEEMTSAQRQENLARSTSTEPAQAKNPASDNAQLVYARGVSGSPGAIICRDYRTVALVFDLYNLALTDRLQDIFTKGLSNSIRGAAAAEPHPAMYGCVLAPQGAQMLKEPGGALPTVTIRLSDGSFFQGVTMPQMFSQSPQ